ncbi:kinase-like domain-containing protein [Pavlovales sp. CCMP2436]|nr:kinase-like domain-containing protein [Pavlovales sp. CCMP2436]
MLHTRSIDMAHRDIKPNNILVDVETLDLWLCDFSMAKSGSLMTQSPGHDLFQAPETRTGASSYTAKCDVWSAGVVWLWMLGGEKLVMEKRWRQQNGKLSFSAALNLTIRARSDANAEPLHSTIWPLLVQMFHEDPDKRPDARVLYDDPTINPLKAEISLLPRRAVVLVLGSDFHLQGEDHCETVIEYLRYCSPHLKEEARIHRLHGGKKGKNLRADELENNLTKCLDEDLLSVEFDVMIYFHSLHGYEINEGGDVAIVLNEKESFAFGPKLAGLKERVERADEWTTAIGEGTILGYLQRHPTMRGKRLIALAGNCREPATTEHRRVVQMPNNQTNGASRPTEVVELVLQYAAQSGGLALLSKGGDASWSKRLVHQDVMSPSTSLMGWLHDASKLLIDEKPQLVDTHILGEVHMLSAMRL